MSASAVRSPELFRFAEPTVLPEIVSVREYEGWNSESFACEQIRGLVRQLFFSSASRSVKQVVFCPLDSQTETADLCKRAGEALAAETPGTVAVVTRTARDRGREATIGEQTSAAIREMPLSSVQNPIPPRSNLWLLNEKEILQKDGQASRKSFYSHLGELRREFAHSIIEERAVSESSDAAILGQLADGIVLILSAETTRRATAQKMKQKLNSAGARILGAVLIERSFPIPEQIYRRL